MVELRGSLIEMRENKFFFILSGCSTDTIVQIFVKTLYDFEHEINTKKIRNKSEKIKLDENKLILKLILIKTN